VTINIIGIGMGGDGTLTEKAREAISASDLLIGAERMLEGFRNADIPCVAEYRPNEITHIIKERSPEKVSVLMSGDCGFYSGAKKLIKALDEPDVTVISGISTPVYFCAKLKMDWSDMHFVSLHGQRGNIARNVSAHEKTFFLLCGDITADELCRHLCSYGLGKVEVHIGVDLSYGDERIISGTAEEIAVGDRIDGLTALIAVNHDFEKYLRTSIPDEEFVRGKVPMTKSELRGAIVSGLNIGRNSVCWDIGCGTGSVSVEAAFRCPDGKIVAIDKKADAVNLTIENAHLFGCDNIEAAEGICPEKKKDMPIPEKVFIGGSSGNMEAIFEAVYSKNMDADIVVTAVSLETLNEAVQCFERFSVMPEIVQLAVTRTKKIGTHTMLQAQNPVFIISGRLT
jgi:precorrin-6Y C5,15-methyltransferase (decarboxylating)